MSMLTEDQKLIMDAAAKIAGPIMESISQFDLNADEHRDKIAKWSVDIAMRIRDHTVYLSK